MYILVLIVILCKTKSVVGLGIVAMIFEGLDHLYLLALIVIQQRLDGQRGKSGARFLGVLIICIFRS